MLSDKERIIHEFESEVLLYMSGELEPDRTAYWDQLITEYPELNAIISESVELLNIYNSQTLHDIDDPEYGRMISKATAGSRNIFWRFINYFRSTESDFLPGSNFTKIAFGSLLAVTAMVMFLVSEKPNHVKIIRNELLDWEGAAISNQINEIETGLSMIEDDKLKQYLLFKQANDEWTRDIYSINKDLEDLLKKTDEKSL